MLLEQYVMGKRRKTCAFSMASLVLHRLFSSFLNLMKRAAELSLSEIVSSS